MDRTEGDQDPRHAGAAEARAALELRLPATPGHTPDSVDWAYRRLLDAEPDTADRAFADRLAHLSRQYAVLAVAGRELSRRDSEFVQQAFAELLAGLPTHPGWVVEDDGTPTVSAARANVLRRAHFREIAERRRQQRSPAVDPESDVLVQASPAASTGELELEELERFVLGRLPAADHPKWRRLRAWVLDDAMQEEVARRAGMSHEALRAEISRFKRRVAPILEAYLAECAQG